MAFASREPDLPEYGNIQYQERRGRSSEMQFLFETNIYVQAMKQHGQRSLAKCPFNTMVVAMIH
jgi:hypothetical protein